MVTIAAARFITEEKMLGSIERGSTRTSSSSTATTCRCPRTDRQLEPVMTIVGGKIVFEALQSRQSR